MSNGTEPANLPEASQPTAGGREYWRSLEELAGTEAFKELMGNHLPRHAAAWTSAMDRREFLKLMGASLALAGVSG
jgi:molybdopterin-containing oxidoreductase family iron-sulfur binding subunit